MDVHEIHARLRAAGKTLADLGDQLGLSHSQVSRLLRGKARMRLDTHRTIEAYLRGLETAATPRGDVREIATPFRGAQEAPIPFITLEEARKPSTKPKLSEAEKQRLIEEIKALSEAYKLLPRVTTLTDDEILGYDENGLPT